MLLKGTTVHKRILNSVSIYGVLRTLHFVRSVVCNKPHMFTIMDMRKVRYVLKLYIFAMSTALGMVLDLFARKNKRIFHWYVVIIIFCYPRFAQKEPYRTKYFFLCLRSVAKYDPNLHRLIIGLTRNPSTTGGQPKTSCHYFFLKQAHFWASLILGQPQKADHWLHIPRTMSLCIPMVAGFFHPGDDPKCRCQSLAPEDWSPCGRWSTPGPGEIMGKIWISLQ